VRALVRWDPVTHAEQELAERGQLRLPPTVSMAELSGPPDAVRELLGLAGLPDRAEVLGPVPVTGPARGQRAGRREAAGAAAGTRRDQGGPAGDGPGDGPAEQVRFLIRVPRKSGPALAVAQRSGQAQRSARKEAGTVRLRLDPAELI
jgi:primosomal protein N' (replication factor Y)